MTTTEQTCRICEAKLDCSEAMRFGDLTFTATVCDACDIDLGDIDLGVRSRRRIDKTRIRHAEFERVCPPIFRLASPDSQPADNGPTHLGHPDFPKKLYRNVIQWKLGPTGLGVVGASGLAKTRIIWLLIHRLWMGGTKTAAFSAVGLQKAIQTQFGSDEQAALLKSAYEAPVLFVDDIGNEKLTETVEGELFNILDTRMEWQRPLLWTSNFGKADFEERWSAPMFRRLEKFSKVIKA